MYICVCVCVCVSCMYVHVCVCMHVCAYVSCCVPVCVCCLRSGTEEEYTELQQLLEDISSYLRDVEAAKVAQKAANKKKDEDDKRKGEQMRKAAMEGIASTSSVVYLYCRVEMEV